MAKRRKKSRRNRAPKAKLSHCCGPLHGLGDFGLGKLKRKISRGSIAAIVGTVAAVGGAGYFLFLRPKAGGKSIWTTIPDYTATAPLPESAGGPANYGPPIPTYTPSLIPLTKSSLVQKQANLLKLAGLSGLR